MKKYSIFLLTIFCFILFYQYADAGKTDPLINIMLKEKNISYRAPSYNNYAKVEMALNEPVTNILIKTNGDNSGIKDIPGIKINTTLNNIITASVPVGSISALSELKNVVFIEAAKKCKTFLDASLISANITSIKTDYGYKGSGIVVGIVDSGIDFTSKDFQNVDNTTRIKYLWDQNLAAGSGEAAPSIYNYGVEYNAQKINAAISGFGTVRHKDTEGHGTHVAGIAAGNGLATGNGQPDKTYVGVASEAEIVCSAIDLASSSRIVDGVDYVFQRAALMGMPAVVNCSFGFEYGPHDGSSLFEQAFDAMTGPGRIIVAAAGNSAEAKAHNADTVVQSNTNTTIFTVASAAQDLLDMWYKGSDKISIQVQKGAHIYPAVPLATGATYTSDTPDGTITIDATISPSPLNGDNEIVVLLDNSGGAGVSTGEWKILIKGDTVVAGGKYDIYSQGIEFVNSTSDGTLGLPATCKKVITVGSYNTKTSWIDIDGNTQNSSGQPVDVVSTFSSCGPTRDNRHKPDLLAPGCVIASTLSKDYFDISFRPVIMKDNKHVLMAGTSMAAPHITGLVALMLQKKNDLDSDAVSTCLIASTGSGGLWDKKNGYGKVKGLAAFLGINAISVAAVDISGVHAYPSPAKGNYVNFVYRVTGECNTIINIFNVAGDRVSTATVFSPNGLNKYAYDISGITQGVYFYQLVVDGTASKSAMKKVAIIK